MLPLLRRPGGFVELENFQEHMLPVDDLVQDEDEFRVGRGVPFKNTDNTMITPPITPRLGVWPGDTTASREVLLDYLSRNLTAEPLNFNANTIRLSFKDNNAFKAQAILNKIDTLYLQYSNEQKNLANKQKIDWLSNELHQIEPGNYAEFTLKTKKSGSSKKPFMQSPATCPASKTWLFKAKLTYADGTSANKTTTTPCSK